MYEISQTLRTAIAAGNPQRVLIEFTHKPDGTAYSPSVVFSNEDIAVSNGLQLTEEFNPETDLTIGSCPSAEIQFTMLNDSDQLVDFEFGTFKAYLGARIDEGTPASGAKTKTFTENGATVVYEFCPLGTFIAPRPDVVKKLMIDVDANDQMTLFDTDMPTSLQEYTGTLAGMATALCTHVGVSLKSTDFLNATMSVTLTAEQSENKTMREVLGWVAEAACSNARFNRDGLLEFVWFSPVNVTFDEHNYTEFTPNWYETKAIDGLHIRNADSTEEYVFGAGTNAYMIQDNPFLRQEAVDNSPKITTQPTSKTATEGSTVTFLVVAENATSYQWKYNDGTGWETIPRSGTIYSGAQTNTLSFSMSATASTRSYKCTVTGNGVDVDSDIVAATVVSIIVMEQPHDAYEKANRNVTFAVDAFNVDTYQWQQSVNDGYNWTNINGETSSELTVYLDASTEAILYRCKMEKGNETVYTDTVQAHIGVVTITMQPQDVTADYGDRVYLSVISSDATEYLWYRSRDNEYSWYPLNESADYSGAESYRLSFVADENSVGSKISYKCRLSNEYGSVESSSAKAELNAIQITRNPQNVQGTSGTTVTMTVRATNATKFKWQELKYNYWYGISSSSNVFQGQDTDTLTFDISSSTADTGGTSQYRCQLWNDDITTPEDKTYSEPATATLIE